MPHILIHSLSKVMINGIQELLKIQYGMVVHLVMVLLEIQDGLKVIY